MCTLSFIPKSGGYFVAMNRDERLTRRPATPPKIDKLSGISVIHPTDIAGGTWIAANAQGTTWALLNWNIASRAVKHRSRGEVVLTVASKSRPAKAGAGIAPPHLDGIEPFRLVGISAEFWDVSEWRWDGENLDCISHAWQANHWFSSGRSDELAAEKRGSAFEQAWRDSEAGTHDWLRKMHASHLPERGAFSVCVHREDAATVSYTEVEVTDSQVRMLYRPGSPCQASDSTQLELHRQYAKPTAIL